MTNSQRQHGIASLAPNEKIVGKPGGLVEPGVKQYGIFKKIKKFGKKVFKSPLGKAAMLGLGAYYAPAMWTGKAGFGGWKTGAGMLRNKMFGAAARGLMPQHPGNWPVKQGLWGGLKKFPDFSRFSRFSLTKKKFPDFSRFSRFSRLLRTM